MPLSFPVFRRETSRDADQYLIDLWKSLEKQRKKGQVGNWTPLNHCWVPVIEYFPIE
jgi:hypothetical protein